MEQKKGSTNVSVDDAKGSKPLSAGYEYVVIPPNGGWGWVVCVSSFIINGIIDGILYSFGIFIIDFERDLNSTNTQAALANSLCIGLHLIFAPFVCALTNTLGFRLITVAGGVISSACFIGCAYVYSFSYIYILYGVINSIGLCMMYMPSILAVAFYFDKYRPIAMAIAVTGTGAGSFIIPPICSVLLKDYDWRVKFQVFGVSVFLSSLLGLTFKPIKPQLVKTQDLSVRPSSQTMITFVEEEMIIAELAPDASVDLVGISSSKMSFWSTQGDMSQMSIDEAHEFRLRKCLCFCDCRCRCWNKKTRNSDYIKEYSNCCPKAKQTLSTMFDFSLMKIGSFTLLVLSGFLTFAGMFVPYTYLVEHSVKHGFNAQSASFLLSIIGVTNAIGRLATGFGVLIPNLKALLITIICLSIGGVVTIGMVVWSNYYNIYICSGLFGFSIFDIFTIN